MPEMNGYDATTAIRRAEQGTGRHISIVAMTAEAMKGDREQCLEAGMDDYISKPFDPESLYRVVAEVPALACTGVETVVLVKSESQPSGPANAYESLPENGVIDWEVARKNVGNDEALLKDLIQIFLTECPHMLAEIHRGVETSDAVLLHRAAHTLKGSAAIFGARPVVEAALRMEMLGRDNNVAQAAQGLDGLL